MDKVPAALADVVEPLREADEYTRLQAIRQRGLYNVLTGLPMPLLASAQLLPSLLFSPDDAARTPGLIALTILLTWVLFGLSCYPQVFLPLVRRRRPDWQSPLLQARLLKNVLEKTFWLQFVAVAAYMAAFFLPIVLSMWVPHALWVGAALVSVVHVAAVTLLALQARHAGDHGLALLFWAMAPLVLFTFYVVASRSFEAYLLTAGAMFYAAVLLPPLVVGFVRLLGPRRWLVR